MGSIDWQLIFLSCVAQLWKNYCPNKKAVCNKKPWPFTWLEVAKLWAVLKEHQTRVALEVGGQNPSVKKTLRDSHLLSPAGEPVVERVQKGLGLIVPIGPHVVDDRRRPVGHSTLGVGFKAKALFPAPELFLVVADAVFDTRPQWAKELVEQGSHVKLVWLKEP